MAEFVGSSFVSGDLLASLARFELAITEKVLFTGAATMARVIYDEVKLNTTAPKLGTKTGNLNSAIYWVKSPEESTPVSKVYKISWNKRKAPHGHLIEFGHFMPYKVVQLRNGDWITLKNRPLASPKFVAARPFIRPAFSRMPEAIKAGLANMTVRFVKEIGI